MTYIQAPIGANTANKRALLQKVKENLEQRTRDLNKEIKALQTTKESVKLNESRLEELTEELRASFLMSQSQCEDLNTLATTLVDVDNEVSRLTRDVPSEGNEEKSRPPPPSSSTFRRKWNPIQTPPTTYTRICTKF